MLAINTVYDTVCTCIVCLCVCGRGANIEYCILPEDIIFF